MSDESLEVPDDFGRPGGTPIRNGKAVLDDLWKELGHDRPPSVLYIFVEPLSVWKISGDSGSGTNPFGHAAVAYTRNGETRVMNIVGATGRQMVNHMSLENYLFGVNDFTAGSEQGGVYNRPMRMVALWDWPEARIQAMQDEYLALERRTEEGEARFFLAFPTLRNFVRRRLPGTWAELGNCARYTSLGMVAGGLRRRTTDWPKRIAVDLLKGERKRNPANVSLIVIDRIKHARLSFGTGADINGAVSPLSWIDNVRFRDLKKRADAEIVVPDGTLSAQARLL